MKLRLSLGMKPVALVVVLLFHVVQVIAQSKSRLEYVADAKVWLGHDISSLEPVVVKSPDFIRMADLDERTMMLYAVVQVAKDFKLEAEHKLLAYSVGEKKLLWSMTFDGSVSRYVRVDTIPMIASMGETWAFHPRTGEELWTSGLEINKFLSQNKALAIGYVRVSPKRGLIKALDPLTGALKWQAPCALKGSESSVALISDTGMVILGTGLGYINLLNGKSMAKAINYVIGQSVPPTQTMAMKGWLQSRALFFVELGTNDENVPLIGRRLTNTVVRNGMIITATASEVKAFSPDGEERWTYRTPKFLRGPSRLFFYDGHLYLFNSGALPDTRMENLGEIFIVKLNPADGAVAALSKKGTMGGMQVKDFMVMDSLLVLSLESGMASVRLGDLELKSNVAFPERGVAPKNGKFTRPSHIMNESGRPEPARAGRGYLLHTDDLNMEFTPSLDFSREVPKDKCYYFSGHIGELMVLSKETEKIIVDDQLNLLPVRFSTKLRVFGHYLFDLQANAILLVPREKLGAEF